MVCILVVAGVFTGTRLNMFVNHPVYSLVEIDHPVLLAVEMPDLEDLQAPPKNWMVREQTLWDDPLIKRPKTPTSVDFPKMVELFAW